MEFRSGYRLPQGQWLLFGLLLTLSVGMMGASGTRFAKTVQSDVNFMLNPVEVWVNDLADTAGSYWSTLTQLDKLRTDNAKLEDENRTLKEELARSAGVAHLNDDWTRISVAQQSAPYQSIIARVVVRDISDVRPRMLTINKGLADGITAGQIVVDAGYGLVGRVQWVQQYNAGILLVNDNSAYVVGKEVDTGAIGTVQGQIGGLMQMSYVNATDKLTKGSPVVTAGMVAVGGDVRSPYPPGLLIGTILSVNRDPNQVVQSAVLQPAADLENVEAVLVITSYQGGFPSPGPSASSSPGPTTSSKPTTTPAPTPYLPPPPTPTVTPPPGLVTPPPH